MVEFSIPPKKTQTGISFPHWSTSQAMQVMQPVNRPVLMGLFCGDRYNYAFPQNPISPFVGPRFLGAHNLKFDLEGMNLWWRGQDSGAAAHLKLWGQRKNHLIIVRFDQNILWIMQFRLPSNKFFYCLYIRLLGLWSLIQSKFCHFVDYVEDRPVWSSHRSTGDNAPET